MKTETCTFPAVDNDHSDCPVCLGEHTIPQQDDVEPPRCATCGGLGMFLGPLGTLLWFRCEQCGLEWNEQGYDTPEEAQQ